MSRQLHIVRLTVCIAILVSAGCDRNRQTDQAIVSGPSMGSSFLGRHRKANCPNCDFPVVCDAERGPDSGQTCCPMCGDLSLEWKSMPEFPGSPCVIDKDRRRPSRQDVVAIRLPETETDERLGIKRVLGLPGETLSFRDGNLLINGQIVRKPPDGQRLVWHPVFDAGFLPAGISLLDRFSPAGGGNGQDAGAWRGTGTGLVFQPGTDEAEIRTLDYRHRPEYPQAVPQTEECRIRDHWTYNQGVSSTMLAVRELAIEMTVNGDVAAELGIVFHYSKLFSPTVVLKLDAANRLTVSLEGRSAPAVSVSRPANSPVSLFASVIDECCVVQVGGETVVEWPFDGRLPEEPDSPDEASIPLPQLSIRAGGARLELGRIRIWRDPMLVWADPFDGPFDADREVRIPAGHYFVVGDNLPVSRDSRNWTRVFVPAADILGVVRRSD